MIELDAVYKIRQTHPWPCRPMSFQCESGDHVWLSGPNGCGKTTLLEIIIGKLSHEGQCRRNFKDSLYIPSVFCFKSVQRVDECLSWLKCLYLSSDSIKDVADRWGIHHCFRLNVSQLSRGQQQRLMLSQLSFSSHKLWVLDEPSLGLDGVGIKLLADAVKDHINQQGCVIEAGHLWPYPWHANAVVEVPH